MVNFAVVGSQGRSHEKKAAALLDFVKITPPPPPPILITCTTFFRRQNSKFESQFRTRNTIYTLWYTIYINYIQQFKVQIIGILV